MVARHAALPRRQRAADAVAQHAGIAGEEIDLVPGLQRQRIERKLDGYILEQTGGFMPVSCSKMAKCCDMRLLARRGGKRQCRLVACPGHGCRLALGGEAEEIALEHLRHDEAGILGNGAIDRADRIADEALQFAHSLAVGREPGLSRARKRQPECVPDCHVMSSIARAHRHCGDAGADQQRAAGAVEDADRPGITHDVACPCGDQRVAEGVGEGER